MNDEPTLHALVWRVEDLLAQNLPAQYGDGWRGWALLAEIKSDLDFMSKAGVASANPIRGLPSVFGPKLVRTIWWVRGECARVREAGIPEYTKPAMERVICALRTLFKMLEQIPELQQETQEIKQ